MLYGMLCSAMLFASPINMFSGPMLLAMVGNSIRDFRIARKLGKELSWREMRLLLKGTEFISGFLPIGRLAYPGGIGLSFL